MTINFRMIWHGDDVNRNVVRDGVHAALSAAAEALLHEANKDVPFKEGTLSGSGDISVDMSKGKATVFYNTPYAVRLHEHPEYNFRNGRKGKWLEHALDANRDRLQDYLRRELNNVFRG